LKPNRQAARQAARQADEMVKQHGENAAKDV
jgi:hypothetical protein